VLCRFLSFVVAILKVKTNFRYKNKKGCLISLLVRQPLRKFYGAVQNIFLNADFVPFALQKEQNRRLKNFVRLCEKYFAAYGGEMKVSGLFTQPQPQEILFCR
jgi:hypothetical protein